MPSAQGNGYYISHWVDECQEEEMRVGTETGSRPKITFVRVFFSSQCNPTISGSTARITGVFRTVIDMSNVRVLFGQPYAGPMSFIVLMMYVI